MNTPRELQTLLGEELHGGHCRTSPTESFKQHPHGLLNLLVRVYYELAICVIDKAHRWPDKQFSASSFVSDSALQPCAQYVQFGLAHGALQPQKKTIIEVRRIVDTIFIKDQRVGQRADLQASVPVHRVPGQSRYFQAEHDAGPHQADLGYQPLESFAIGGGGARLPQIRIDDDDPVQRPSQRDGLLSKRILPLRALGVLQHLTQSGLPDIKISIALQVTGLHFLMCIVIHRVTSHCFSRTIPARRATISDRMPDGIS